MYIANPQLQKGRYALIRHFRGVVVNIKRLGRRITFYIIASNLEGLKHWRSDSQTVYKDPAISRFFWIKLWKDIPADPSKFSLLRRPAPARIIKWFRWNKSTQVEITLEIFSPTYFSGEFLALSPGHPTASPQIIERLRSSNCGQFIHFKASYVKNFTRRSV